MADFTPRSVVKSAVRTLTTPIPTLAAFSALVDDIITTNPFSCTGYELGGVTHDPCEVSRESDTARVADEDLEATVIGTTSVKCPTSAAYTAAITAVPACTGLNTALGETAIHVLDDDSFSATIKCHAASGELYNVAISRTQVTVSGYEADAILTAVEAWADGQTDLA